MHCFFVSLLFKSFVMEIDQIIKNRKTQKVLAESEWPIETDQTELHQTLDELLDLAAVAPYHKKCDEHHTTGELTSCVPWRFYVLDTTNSRTLLAHIEKEDIKAGKVTNMLYGCDSLILVTWLPETSDIQSDIDSEVEFEGNLKNMEHIAGASCAIQNVLLGATARNIPNFWSSGGALRLKPLRDYLNIPLSEVLLGGLFLFPKDVEERDVFVKSGQFRDQGKEKGTWSKSINL